MKSIADRLIEEGFARGFAKGFTKGFAKGLAKGEAEIRRLKIALKKSRRCHARALLALGKSQAEAAGLSGLDMNEVAVLAKEQSGL